MSLLLEAMDAADLLARRRRFAEGHALLVRALEAATIAAATAQPWGDAFAEACEAAILGYCDRWGVA